MSKNCKAWIYFDEIPNSLNVICKICKKELKRSDKSTRPMWSHLEYVHEAEHKLVKPEKGQESKNKIQVKAE